MADAIRFFQQYESAIYFLLGLGILYYAWRFYKNWEELRGSVFGLEQRSAQRRLTRSAIAIFVMLLLGVGVFSLVTFAQSVIDSAELVSNMIMPENEADSAAVTGDETIDENGNWATATPLPTVAVDPSSCDPETINITSPVINQEIRGEVEITGLVNVDDFGYFVLQFAKPDAELWTSIQASRSLVEEEAVLAVWDTSRWPADSYILQLVVTTSNGDEYPPCRVPIRIANP
ncbi:hypothetical protein KQH54_03550 [bacterium]|nr:hypothetical protein [bacterium]